MKYNKRYKCYVSKEGLVFGIKDGKLILRSLKPFPGKKYIRVYVWDYETNKNVSKRLHRLVWETFNGEIPQGMQIDHEDGHPENNCLDNLRLATAKENSNNPATAWKTKGTLNGMYGKHHTEDSKHKISTTRNAYWLNKYNMTVREIQAKLNRCYETVLKYDRLNILKEKL